LIADVWDITSGLLYGVIAISQRKVGDIKYIKILMKINITSRFSFFLSKVIIEQSQEYILIFKK
tara:strand:- start:239 stop:430 length:192 start_codon:yes stop_codon:yes gene_type:complete